MSRAKWIAPLGILGAGIALCGVLIALREPVERETPEPERPLVRVIPVTRERVQLVVRAQGTVVPRTESDLVAQVAGTVEWVAPDLVSGGFFAAGDPLVRIERSDYQADLESARAGLARARSEFDRAGKERERQRRLADRSIAAESRIDDAENAYRVAEAVLREARARLSRAERDLSRTEIEAPYDGRVRRKNVDVGQFVNRGEPLATIYAVDYAEVRLPVPDRELRHLDLPLGFQGSAQVPDGPTVRLHAEFAGEDRTWEGRVVRTEGEIDPRSRTVNVVARVEDPYGREGPGREVPLAVGLFVDAEILGVEIADAFVAPRGALRADDRLLVVDEEQRLHFREVEVLRLERDEVVIGEGVRTGERVCVSPLPAAVEGMGVRVLGAEPGPDVAGAGS